MRLLEHDVSRAIRFFRVETQSGKDEHGPFLARAFEDRYEFMQGPRTVEEYDLTRGVVFRHGVFRGQLVERVQLFNTGMLAEGKFDTDELDAFIDDVIGWGENERGLRFVPNPDMLTIKRAYYSQLFFELPERGSAGFEIFSDLGGEVMEAMASDGFPQTSGGFTGISVGPDPASGASWVFRFERRAAQPFSSNQFYSAAPMRTKAHVALLERFEKRIIGQTSALPLPSSQSPTVSEPTEPSREPPHPSSPTRPPRRSVK